MIKMFFKFLSILFLSSFFYSCAKTINPNVERGSGYQFQDGYPEVRLSAIGFLEEDRGYINIAVDIVEGSLIYKSKNGKFNAKSFIKVELKNTEDESFVKTDSLTITFNEKKRTVIDSQNFFSFQKKIYAKPGKYIIHFTVEDVYSGKFTRRTTTAFIPNSIDDETTFANIRLLSKKNNSKKGWLPITSYEVSSKKDSIQFVTQATNLTAGDPLSITTRLIKFEADTSIAQPMSFSNSVSGKNSYFDYGGGEVLESSSRILNQSGNIFLIFKFPLFDKGNYRFEVTGKEKSGTTFFKARDFSIRSPNFPTVKSARELARPLVYLMNKEEYQSLIQIQDNDSLKAEMDRFWLRNIGNKSDTKSTIRLFYERVEEANKQFSNYKEGWKTDFGMVYILFGPPWYEKKVLDTKNIVWSYTHDHYGSNLNFTFFRPIIKSEFFPFDNYILNRSETYFQLEHQQIELWKSGLILKVRI